MVVPRRTELSPKAAIYEGGGSRLTGKVYGGNDSCGKVVQIGDVRKCHQNTAVAEKLGGSNQNTDMLDRSSPTSLLDDFCPPDATSSTF